MPTPDKKFIFSAQTSFTAHNLDDAIEKLRDHFDNLLDSDIGQPLEHDGELLLVVMPKLL